jgi:signal transduction histidine kinase
VPFSWGRAAGLRAGGGLQRVPRVVSRTGVWGSAGLAGYSGHMEAHEAQAGVRRLRVALAPDVHAPAAARRALRELPLGEHGADAVLLASELVTNAVEHAGLAPDQRIELAATCDRERTRVEVRDRGRGFAPDVAPGLGLQLLDRITERWGVEHNGVTCVWFELVDGPRSLA